MAPECRSLKLLLKSSKLNQHILIEVETILLFLFSPTSLYKNFKQIERPGCRTVQDLDQISSAKSQVVRVSLIMTVPFSVCKASSFRC